MKKIRLSRIHYINWMGIVLHSAKPSLDATEENLFKLKKFIDNKMLEVIGEEENEKIEIENPPMIEKPLTQLDFAKEEEIFTSIERVELHTEASLLEKQRKELLEIANNMGIEFKKNISTKALIELIIEKQ
ncbi:MAG: hypothetical protein ACRC0G_16370 [Fusobacteriaceae bacterium]